MARLIVWGVIVAVIGGALAGIRASIRSTAIAETRAAVLEDVHQACGEKAATPKDCYTAGVESVRAEFVGKIQEANATIASQGTALTAAQSSIDKLRADSAVRAKAAAAAMADLEARARDATDRLSAILSAQPTPGVSPCESACTLLRSSFY